MSVLEATEHKQDTRKELPPGWRWVKLGEMCELNPRRPSLDRADNAPTTFVPMPAVDGGKGTIVRPEVRPYAEVKKGYTYFTSGDVLFAKITPCMENGKHAIVRGLVDGIGFGSTEFHVIRPGLDACSEWLHFFVRQPHVLHEATSHFTGAVGQRRVPETFLSDLKMPLPPLWEQKRIAAILNEQMELVERARVATKAQFDDAKALTEAYLRQAFPAVGRTLPLGWRWVNLGDAISVKSGNFLSVSQMDATGTFHVYGGNGVTGRHNCFMFKEPKIIIGRVGALCGCVHITEPNSWVTDNALYIEAKRLPLDDYFLFYCLKKLKLRQYANQMGQPVISGHSIYEVAIPLPPIEDQKRIVSMLGQQLATAEELRSGLQAELVEINALPSVLLRRAFNGEL